MQSSNFPQASLLVKTCICGGSTDSGRVLLQGRGKSGDQAELHSNSRAPPLSWSTPSACPLGLPQPVGAGQVRCHRYSPVTPPPPFTQHRPSSPPFFWIRFDSVVLFQKVRPSPQLRFATPEPPGRPCHGPLRGLPTAAAACLEREGSQRPAPKASVLPWRFWKAFLVLPWMALKRRACGRPGGRSSGPLGPVCPGEACPCPGAKPLSALAVSPTALEGGLLSPLSLGFRATASAPCGVGTKPQCPEVAHSGPGSSPEAARLLVGQAPGLQPPGV